MNEALAEPVPQPPKITLSAEQEAALQRIMRMEEHGILTGKAGSGKSTVLKELALRMPIAICATTARAALQVGGITIDRLFCFRRDTWKVQNERRLEDNMIACPDLIVIDEASMMGAAMCDLVAKLAKAYRKRLLLVGDWAQASPVKDEWGVTSALFAGATFIRLVENHRQADQVYLAALNKVRSGVVDDEVRGVFAPCLVAGAPDDDAYIRFFATNKAADSYNQQRLMSLTNGSTLVTTEAGFIDQRDVFDARKEGVFQEDVKEKHKQEAKVAHNEQFRVGARIIMTLNDNQDAWVNGDTGVIEDIVTFAGKSLKDTPYNPFSAEPPILATDIRVFIVRLDRTNAETLVDRVEQPVSTPSGKPYFAIRGFPLRLGWAITVHRSQGMTVDRAFLDMATITWMVGESKHGLAYVAMSRTRTLEGLKIANWNDEAVYCADAVKPYI